VVIPGTAITYTGLLTGVSVPDVDANGNGPADFSLTFSITDVVTAEVHRFGSRRTGPRRRRGHATGARRRSPTRRSRRSRPRCPRRCRRSTSRCRRSSGPNVEVLVRSNVTIDELNEWRKGAKDPTFDGGYNLVRLVCILLANASVDIVVDGKSTGMTLADPKIKADVPDSRRRGRGRPRVLRQEDLWLSARGCCRRSAAWAGGEQDGDLLRPTTVD
jgi:hypothetical protein